MINDDRMTANLAVIHLAQAATHKKIIRHYAPTVDPKLLQMYHVGTHPMGWNHRESEVWTKTEDALFAVRAHRLFIQLFPNNTDYSMKLSAKDLYEWFFCYSQIYPNDEMTTNRLHYMVGMVRDLRLRIKENCAYCHQSYVIHQDMYTQQECAVCKRLV